MNRLKAATAAFCLALSLSPLTNAQEIRGPVSLLVPYPAGGASDVTARIVAGPISEQLKTTVVVENVGGATGGIAIQKLLNAQADGRIFFQGSPNEIILPPYTIKSVKHKPEDFDILHPVTNTSMVLVARKGLSAKNLEDFIALGKSHAASEPLTYGSPGIGSLYHLLGDSIGKQAGFIATHVPYKGAAPLLQDLIGDRIDFAVIAYTASTLQALDAGHYQVIAHMSNEKPKALAELPSLSENPAFSGFNHSGNAAYYVKKGTPREIREKLSDAIAGALSTPEVINALEADGRRVPSRMTLEEAEAFYVQEIQRYQDLVKQVGFEPLD